MFHSIPALLLVGIGLGQPSDFPHVIGQVVHMSSLRGVWGRTWHQHGRHVITSIAVRIRDDILCVSAGSPASCCIQLCTGFALGAGTHFVGGWMAGGRRGWQDESAAVTFFAMQLLGIVLEDSFIQGLLAFRVLGHDWRRPRMPGGESRDGVHESQRRLALLPELLGYVWVFGWLGMTIPPYIEGLSKVGAVGETLVPFSFLNWAVGVWGGMRRV